MPIVATALHAALHIYGQLPGPAEAKIDSNGREDHYKKPRAVELKHVFLRRKNADQRPQPHARAESRVCILGR